VGPQGAGGGAGGDAGVQAQPLHSQDLLPKLVELHKHLTEVEGDLITEAEE
jgi:hypothetical protein